MPTAGFSSCHASSLFKNCFLSFLFDKTHASVFILGVGLLPGRQQSTLPFSHSTSYILKGIVAKMSLVLSLFGQMVLGYPGRQKGQNTTQQFSCVPKAITINDQ